MDKVFGTEDWKQLAALYCRSIAEYAQATVKYWPIQLNTQAPAEAVAKALKELAYLLDMNISDIPATDLNVKTIANTLVSITEIVGDDIKAHQELFISSATPLSYILVEVGVVIWTTFNSFVLYKTPRIPRRLAVYNLLRSLSLMKRKDWAHKKEVTFCND